MKPKNANSYKAFKWVLLKYLEHYSENHPLHYFPDGPIIAEQFGFTNMQAGYHMRKLRADGLVVYEDGSFQSGKITKKGREKLHERERI